MKAHVKKVKIGPAKDEELNKLFNQMIGCGTGDLPIVRTKCIQLRSECQQILRIFKILQESPPMKCEPVIAREIAAMCEAYEAQINKLFDPLVAQELIFEKEAPVAEETSKAFYSQYEAVKSSKVVGSFILMCSKLSDHSANLIISNHLFVMGMAGVEWTPLPFASFNIKDMFNYASPVAIQFIMSVLLKLYEHSLAVYNLINSPDIDIDNFSELIMKNIDELRRQPKLSRCDAAFSKIKESVSLLKGNFTTYYKDFLQTRDNFTIMEHFIIDVSTSGTTSPEITRQFRVIINYYRELASQDPGNTSASGLFSKLDATLNRFGDENHSSDIPRVTITKPSTVVRTPVTALRAEEVLK